MKKSFGGMLVVVLTLGLVVLGCTNIPPATTENVSQGKNFGFDIYQPYRDKSMSIDEQSYLLNMLNIESKMTTMEMLESDYEFGYRITFPGTPDNGRNTAAGVANALWGAAVGTNTKSEAEPVGIGVIFNHSSTPRLYWLPPGERTLVLNEEQWQRIATSTPGGGTAYSRGKMINNKVLDKKTVNLEAGHYYYLRNDGSNRMVVEELTRDGGSVMMWDFKLKKDVEVPMSAVIDGIDVVKSKTRR